MKRFHHKKDTHQRNLVLSNPLPHVLFIAQFNFFGARSFRVSSPMAMPATAKSHFKLWDYVSLMKVLVFKIESDVEISGHICSISDRYPQRLRYKMNFLMVHIHFSLPRDLVSCSSGIWIRNFSKKRVWQYRKFHWTCKANACGKLEIFGCGNEKNFYKENFHVRYPARWSNKYSYAMLRDKFLSQNGI